jgi:hypothetical protein
MRLNPQREGYFQVVYLPTWRACNSSGGYTYNACMDMQGLWDAYSQGCRFRYNARLLFIVEIDRTWLCMQLQCQRPLDLHQYPRLLLIQTCFRHQQALQFPHQSSTHNRHQTVCSPHPQTRSFLLVLPYRTRHPGTTATPLRHMTEILPTIVLHRKAAATSWARCRPENS